MIIVYSVATVIFALAAFVTFWSGTTWVIAVVYQSGQREKIAIALWPICIILAFGSILSLLISIFAY